MIDTDTSFRALLGRPWLHEYGMVVSTVQQCMMYLRNREDFRISGNLQPCFVHEVKIYKDAKYFLLKESMPVEPFKVVTSNSGTKKQLQKEKEQKQRESHQLARKVKHKIDESDSDYGFESIYESII